MNMDYKPPRKKRPGPQNNPESTDGRRPGERQHPAAAERVNDESAKGANDPPAPATRETRDQPVTNQDEQNKITNASSDDQPIADK